MTHFNINPTQHRILTHLRDNGEILLSNGYPPRSLNEVVFALVQHWVKANPARRAYLLNIASGEEQLPRHKEEDEELFDASISQPMTEQEEVRLTDKVKEYKTMVMPELPPLRTPASSVRQTGVIRTDRFSLRDDK